MGNYQSVDGVAGASWAKWRKRRPSRGQVGRSGSERGGGQGAGWRQKEGGCQQQERDVIHDCLPRGEGAGAERL